jgi:lyso-ornithine lipid O-acyltransferase
VARLINLRVTTYGKVPLDTSGLLVSNHLGYLDIVTHATIFSLRFSPSTEAMKIPVIGTLIQLTNPVVVDRTSPTSSKRTLRDYAKTMLKGMYMIVYPEGTSTDGKNGLRPFKSTSFEAAISGNLPVLPILTRYIEPPGRPTVCWYGDMSFLPHFWQVLGVPSIEAELHFLPPIFSEGRPRKEFSRVVHDIMEGEYRNLKKKGSANG